MKNARLESSLHRHRFVPLALLLWLLAGQPVRAQDPAFYDEASIPELELRFFVDDWLDRLVEIYNNGNTEFLAADLTHDGTVYPQVGVQHKGDFSYHGDIRENIKITMDAFVSGQELLGYDKITLDTGSQTTAFNEVAATWILRDFMICPLANLAHLTLGTDSQMYDVGVMTNTERVDAGFIRRSFGEKAHRYHPTHKLLKTFIYLGDLLPPYADAYEVQGGDDSDIYVDVARASVELENAHRRHVKSVVDPFIHLDSCMIHLIANRMLGNVDGMERGNNYYLVQDVPGGSRMCPVPWDLDFAFFDNLTDPVPDETNYPLAKIFKVETQLERAHTYVRHLLDRGFRNDHVAQRLSNLKAIALPIILNATHDDLKSESDVDDAISVIVNRIDKIRRVLNNDSTYTRELVAITELSHNPQSPTRHDDVWVTARVSLGVTALDSVLLWCRNTAGPFQPIEMLDDGNSNDGAHGDGVYGAMLPRGIAGKSLDFYVEGRPDALTAAGYGFSPVETEFQPRSVMVGIGARGLIRINEVLADNEAGDVDEAGDAQDWVEIVNLGDTDYDLAGHFLSDEEDSPEKWEFPSSSVVPAKGFLRVWCDDEGSEGPLHANFRLSKEGEQVFLSASEALGGERLDQLTFGAQKEDRSFGHIPDGDESGAGQRWYYIWDPSGEAPALGPGEFNRYDGRITGSSHGFKLRMDGKLEVGETLRFELRGGRPGAVVPLFISAGPDKIDVGSLGIIAVDLRNAIRIIVPLDAAGDANWSATVPPSVGGLKFYAQALDQDLSNAVTGHIEP